MNCVFLAFALAIVCTANLPFLIDWSGLVAGLPFAVCGLATRVRVVCGFYLGAFFALYVANERISGGLPALLAALR